MSERKLPLIHDAVKPYSKVSIANGALWLLGELASELSTALDLESLQRILNRKLRWILDFDRCTLAVRPEPFDSEYLLLEITSPSKAERTPLQKISLNQGWPGRVLTDSKPYFLADLNQLPPLVELPAEDHWGIAAKACSLMLLPLRIGECTIGSLNFSAKTPGTYSVDYRNLAELLAGQVRGQLGSILAHRRATLALKALERSKAELKGVIEFRERVMESATNAIYTLDLAGSFTLVNQQTAEMTGYSAKELIGLPFGILFASDEAFEIQKQIVATVSCGASTDPCDVELIRKDATTRIVTFSLAPLVLGGKTSAVVGTAQDITQRKRVEEALAKSEARFRSLIQNSSDIITILKLDGTLGYNSPSIEKILGYRPEDLSGKSAFELVHPEDLSKVLDVFKNVVQNPSTVLSVTFRFRHQDGSWCFLESTGNNLLGDSSVAGIVVNSRDITERRRGEQALLRAKAAEVAKQALEKEIIDRMQAEAQLLHHAFYDGLTGLANRALFMDRLGHVVERANRRGDYSFAVLFLDLDRFKVINDSLGHLAGDQLLVAIARRLETCLRPSDTAARLGGDEFTILLEDIKLDPQGGCSDAIQVAERIQRQLALPFHLNEHEVFTSASIGITLGGTTLLKGDPRVPRSEDILRNADIAMYRSKTLGRARYQVFDQTMYTHAVARLQLETDLRRAVERQEFQIHYQPIVSLETGKITGFEALVRWQHPEQGIVSPAKFIPLAEETGLIIPIGQWVLREACDQMCQWQTEFSAQPGNSLPNQSLAISVNLSGKQLTQPDLIEQIDQILQETGLEASSLNLEITESVIVGNTESATAVLLQLQSLDIQLHMDDFGTGYSSLSYLHRFPISAIKIDRSFVSNIAKGSENLEIVRAIVTLADNLGMNVIAEGMETGKQLAQLRALKCKHGQGYLFSKPVDSVGARALIAAQPLW